jgi:hypothetical protein
VGRVRFERTTASGDVKTDQTGRFEYGVHFWDDLIFEEKTDKKNIFDFLTL